MPPLVPPARPAPAPDADDAVAERSCTSLSTRSVGTIISNTFIKLLRRLRASNLVSRQCNTTTLLFTWYTALPRPTAAAAEVVVVVSEEDRSRSRPNKPRSSYPAVLPFTLSHNMPYKCRVDSICVFLITNKQNKNERRRKEIQI